MLAGHRFNRLHLAFGLGYDALRRVADSYLLFLYPFLLSVPGYDVRATNLPDAERDRNLDMLRFISEETVRRGLEFQLGIWMHGYQLAASPDARYLSRGSDAGDARGVLPRRPDGPAAGVPRHFLGRPPHPRRERHRRRQLRLLEDHLRRRDASRTSRGDRSPRQGHRRNDDRQRAGDRHARQPVAEVLGRAPRHAVPPGGDSGPGDAGRRATRAPD